jgi:acylphosphatase
MDGNAPQVRQVLVRSVFVEGAVQGVGYREFVRRSALRLDVSGWVRNRTDGSVEALLQGDAANLDALLTEMRRGPPYSAVAGLRVVECEGSEVERIGEFVIRPTS